MKMIMDGGFLFHQINGIKGFNGLKSNGVKTGIAYGVMNKLRKLYKDGYERIEIALDFGSPEHRYRMYPDYKGNRGQSSNLQKDEVKFAVAFLKNLGVLMYEHPLLEADDVIGVRARETDEEMHIYTSDSDLFQLVDGTTKIYHGRSQEILGVDGVEDKVGVRPKDIVEFYSLMGDSSDNIDGISGIGKVRAKKIINDEEITDRTKGLLEDNQEKIERNKKLILLKRKELLLLENDGDFKTRKMRKEKEMKMIQESRKLGKVEKYMRKYEMERLLNLTEVI